jgi:hypothetical protein
MRIWNRWLLLPSLALCVALVGCGGGKNKDEDDNTDAPRPRPTTDKPIGPAGTDLKPYASTGTTTIKGKVTLTGGEPDVAALTQRIQGLMKAKDEKTCLAPTASELEKSQFEWIIDPATKGVANVFVWVRPPKGQFFPIDLEKKTWQDDVILDQPHCAFVPHCVLLFPKTRDTKKPSDLIPTKQKLIVKNSAPTGHNTSWKGGTGQDSGDKLISSGASLTIDRIVPSDKPISISCTIHAWMSAYAWALDHPYGAITKPDGTYEIKDVPVGTPVQIVAWHEKANFLTGTVQGESLKLEPGTTTKDFTMQAK